MAGPTKATQVLMLDWLTDTAVATTKFIGLLSGTPSDDAGTGLTEVSTSGTAYARQSMGLNGSAWAAAAQGATGAPSSVANGSAVTFAQATASYAGGANITYFGLYDASTSGTLVAFGALGTAKPVLSGDTPSFAIGALVLKLGDPTDAPY